MTEASDDELVALAGKGDRVAFTRLVQRHRARILALALRMLGERAAAEDIVQEAFTRAWVNAPRWQARDSGAGRYFGWLARVAVNLVLDRKRKHATVALEAAGQATDAAPSAETGLIAHERAERIRAAIAALPERQRLAISLTYDAELSNAAAAAAMGTSIGAFELLLVRARRALRLSFAEE